MIIDQQAPTMKHRTRLETTNDAHILLTAKHSLGILASLARDVRRYWFEYSKGQEKGGGSVSTKAQKEQGKWAAVREDLGAFILETSEITGSDRMNIPDWVAAIVILLSLLEVTTGGIIHILQDDK